LYLTVLKDTQVNARAGEVLLPINEPLYNRDDENDEEYHNTVIYVELASVACRVIVEVLPLAGSTLDRRANTYSYLIQ
jgi:hypothetical protein